MTQILMHKIDTPHKQYGIKYKLALLLCFYFFTWLIIRIAALEANVLWADDFLNFVDHSSTIVDHNSCRNPFKDYRVVYVGLRCFSSSYIPEFTLSIWPKILSGLFLACFSLLLFHSAKSWGSPKIVAAMLPLPLLSHPIINEITLWNMTGVYSLWLTFCALAYVLISKPATLSLKIIATLLLLITVLAYEFFITTFLLFVLASPLIKLSNNKDFKFRTTFRLVLVFMSVVIFYIAFVKVINIFFPFTNNAPRGIVSIVEFDIYLLEKFHGIFNLLVNVFAMPISYYLDFLTALRVWEAIPIALVISTFALAYFYHKSFFMAILMTFLALVLLIMPVLPIFASSQSPESWRTSIPILIGACFIVTALLNLIYRLAEQYKQKNLGLILSISIVLLLSGFLAKVSYEESKIRVYESILEEELIGEIERFWASKSVDKRNIKVGRITALNLQKKPSKYPAEKLSVAYNKRGLNSNFKIDFAWRGKLLLAGFNIVELSLNNTTFDSHFSQNCDVKINACRPELNARLYSKCYNVKSYTQKQTGIRLVHDEELRISAICI